MRGNGRKQIGKGKLVIRSEGGELKEREGWVEMEMVKGKILRAGEGRVEEGK